MREAVIFHCDVEVFGAKIKKGTFVRQKEWVGLTVEEKQYLNEVLNLQGRFPIIDAIEAKLKEKNGG